MGRRRPRPASPGPGQTTASQAIRPRHSSDCRSETQAQSFASQIKYLAPSPTRSHDGHARRVTPTHTEWTGFQIWSWLNQSECRNKKRCRRHSLRIRRAANQPIRFRDNLGKSCSNPRLVEGAWAQKSRRSFREKDTKGENLRGILRARNYPNSAKSVEDRG